MKKKIMTWLSGIFLVCMMILAMPSVKAEAYGLTQTSATQDTITIAWSPEAKALNYKVYLVTRDEAYNSIETLYQTLTPDVTNATITGVQPGSKVNVKVTYDCPNWNNTQIYTYTCASSSDLFTLPGKVQNVRQEKWWYWINQLSVVWDKQEGVDGYEFIVKDSKNKTVTKGTSNYAGSANLDVRNVKNSMVYTVQVRAYKYYSGKTCYGDWSTKTYCFTQAQVKKAKVSKKKLTVKWAKVNGATGYDIYVSTKPQSGYKKVKSVGKNTTSSTITKLSGKKFNAKKTYYVYVVTKKKVGKKTNTSGRLYYWNTKSTSFGYFQ